MFGAYCTPRKLRRKSVSNTCARAQGQPCQRRSVRPRDRSNHEHSSGLVALKDILVETPSGGQPSGGAPPARQRRMPELAGEIQRKEAEDEELEGEVVQDLIGDVHMKLSAPLVSRENSGAARVCNCTVFQQREGAIMQNMKGWLYSDKVAEQVKRKNMGSPLTPGASCSVS